MLGFINSIVDWFGRTNPWLSACRCNLKLIAGNKFAPHILRAWQIAFHMQVDVLLSAWNLGIEQDTDLASQSTGIQASRPKGSPSLQSPSPTTTIKNVPKEDAPSSISADEGQQASKDPEAAFWDTLLAAKATLPVSEVLESHPKSLVAGSVLKPKSGRSQPVRTSSKKLEGPVAITQDPASDINPGTLQSNDGNNIHSTPACLLAFKPLSCSSRHMCVYETSSSRVFIEWWHLRQDCCGIVKWLSSQKDHVRNAVISAESQALSDQTYWDKAGFCVNWSQPLWNLCLQRACRFPKRGPEEAA